MKRLFVFFAVLVVSTTAFASGTGVAAAPQAALDRLTCYPGTAVKGAFPDKAAAVLLENSNEPSGMLASVANFSMHCTPPAPMTNPDGHLACFAITPNVVEPFTIALTNDFGQGTVVASNAVSLCLPTPASSGLDHYSCYNAKEGSGTPRFNPPSSIALQDEFGTSTAKLGAPALLCVPSVKTIDPAVPGESVHNADTLLLCFTATQTKVVFPKQVVDSNQFGAGQVKLRHSNGTWLCLPSHTP